MKYIILSIVLSGCSKYYEIKSPCERELYKYIEHCMDESKKTWTQCYDEHKDKYICNGVK